MKLTFNLGDEFENCKVNIPDNLKVTDSSGNEIGKAEISIEHKTAEVTLNDSSFQKENISIGFAGTVLERNGNLITKFKLDSVSIIKPNKS